MEFGTGRFCAHHTHIHSLVDRDKPKQTNAKNDDNVMNDDHIDTDAAPQWRNTEKMMRII